MPSLRIDQSDLKCKNGCDYFGNPQWQGYCSKCHREQLHRQRLAEKAEKASSGTLPKPEQKKAGSKLASHSSFSKFEEKRLRQSEKKPNLLKFNVFKKINIDEQELLAERKPPQFKVPAQVYEKMKSDFRARFPSLPQQADRDARVFVHGFITDVISYCNLVSVDELSERVQRQYQRFMRYLETAAPYSSIDAETREKLVDFVEKHAMSYLHELPSVVFSPCGTDDERLDRAMFERIQQLSWVGERHLECKLNRNSDRCRKLLYKAISELLGMDSAVSPGSKLYRVRRACGHVLALCGGAAPASADDLLPALIFTVLKANPPRLVSNINFVTRFCNAPRLMTGEAGYYFTNLCCAVSFIENLSAESLSMDKKEFDCYMAMPASIGGSAWAAALSLCGAAREAGAQRAAAAAMQRDLRELCARAEHLADNAHSFEQEITKKVEDVLAKTPLTIQPRRELPRLAPLRNPAPLVDLAAPPPQDAPPTQQSHRPSQPSEPPLEQNDSLLKQGDALIRQSGSLLQKDGLSSTSQENPEVQIIPEIKPVEVEPIMVTSEPKESEEQKNVYHFDTPKLSPSKSPLLDQPWVMKQTSSLELLTPSPLGFAPFDRSIDELLTPDEFATDHLAPGLSNINYDIDLSDFSGDNSFAEDAPKSEAKDPFSPDGLKKGGFDPFAPQPSTAAYSEVEKYDEFSLVDSKMNASSDPFEVIHRSDDPFSAVMGKFEDFTLVDKKTNLNSAAFQAAQRSDDPFSPQNTVPRDPFSPQNTVQRDPFSPVHKESTSILDDSGSPTSGCLLPSPLQPQTSKPS
ncbi:rab5 GDP/GTP exchange factor isoform X2 [Epargyreus clarus]